MTVIRGKCAMLKLEFSENVKIINKDKLPYKFPMSEKNITNDYRNNERCYCEKIAKYIMYNHANKLGKISSDTKYINTPDFKQYISQYE